MSEKTCQVHSGKDVPCGAPATHYTELPATGPWFACADCAEKTPLTWTGLRGLSWRPLSELVVFVPEQPYPLTLCVPMPDAERCEKCGGQQFVKLEVTRSDWRADSDYQHAAMCPTLFCPHNKRLGAETCEACRAEDDRWRNSGSALRALCGDLAYALDEAGTHYPTDRLRMAEERGYDRDDCLAELREVNGGWPEALYAIPTDLGRRVRRALGIPGPLAFLAVGQERFEDVLANAHAFNFRGVAREFKDATLEGPAAVLKLLHSLAEDRRFICGSSWGERRAEARLGIAWRAYRAWRREQVQP